MGTERDYAKELLEARADLKGTLALGLAGYADEIMAKVDALITLETDWSRRDRRRDELTVRKHEVLVRAARRSAAEMRNEARALRGEDPEPPPRTCSSCKRNVRDNPELTFYANKKHPEKLRTQCTDCEKKNTRDNTERRRREAEAAGKPWPPQKATATAGKLRAAKPKRPASDGRHLRVVSSS